MDIDNIQFYVDIKDLVNLKEDSQPKLQEHQKSEKYKEFEQLEEEIMDFIKEEYEDMDVDVKILNLENLADLEEIDLNKVKNKLKKQNIKNQKLYLIEEEIKNLLDLLLNNQILTMPDNQFAALLNKFGALKKEVIELQNPVLYSQYEQMMEALNEIEQIRQLGTLDPDSFTLKGLKKLEDKLMENNNIDLTKFPGFINHPTESIREFEELTKDDKEQIKQMFFDQFGYELDDEELELVIESIRNNEADIEKVSQKKKKKFNSHKKN